VAAFPVALGGRITLHWVAELIAFSKQPGLGAIKHLRPVIAPVADDWVSAQGLRMKNACEDLEHVLVVPCGYFSSSAQAVP
jgi:hypothetical protein